MGSPEGVGRLTDRLRAPIPAQADIAVGALIAGAALGVVLGHGATWTHIVGVLGFLLGLRMVATGTRRLRDRERVDASREARSERLRADQRRHPVRWLLGIPALSGLYGAAKYTRYHPHPHGVAVVVIAAGSAAIGLVVSGVTVWRAQH